MSADKEVLIQIKVDNEAAQKSITEQTRKIDLLKGSNEKLKKTNKELAKQGSVTAAERSKNNEQITKNSVKISEANKVRKRSINTLKAEAGSLTDLRNKLATLTDARNKNLTVGTEAFNKANQEIKELTTTIKEAEQGGDDFRRSVGKYPGTFKDAAAAMGGFTTGTEGASGAMDVLGKVIKLNPIGILISLVLAMVAAFGKSEEGARKLKLIMSVLNSVFKDFVSLLASGGESIVEFFENPAESIKNFGQVIQDFVISQIETLLQGLGKLGDAFVLLFEGEFSAAADAAADGFGDVVRGANPLVGITETLIEKGGEYIETTKDNAKATLELTDANYKLERSLLGVEKQVIALQGQEEVLKRSTEDSTKSFKEQEEAQKELEATQKARFDLQQSVINTQIGIIQKELSLARSRGEQTLEIQQRLNEKEKELITNRNEQRSTEAENLQIAAQREQDIWEQELDFIIDVGERKRVALENQALNENNSLAERTEGLRLYDESLQRFLETQRSSFEEEGLTEEEFNRLLGIADPEKLAEAITAQETLSEIEKNRLREVFIEFENAEIEKAKVHEEFNQLTIEQDQELADEKARLRAEEDAADDKAAKDKIARNKKVATQGTSAINDAFAFAQLIAKKDEKLSKALAITKTVVNTAVGIGRAFADLPIYAAIPAAAVVAATGITQIAAISNSGGDGGGTPTPPTGNTPNTPNPQNQADTSNADAAFAEQTALENAIAGMNMNVSVSEINNAQNNVAVSEENSTIGN